MRVLRNSLIRINITGGTDLRYCKKCETNRKNEEFYTGNTTCIPCAKVAYKTRRDGAQNATTGFLYVITNPAWDGYYKVGKTTNLSNRLATYMTGSPLRDYNYLFTIEVDDVNVAERLAHQKLSEYYEIKGEWVVASKHEAIIKILEAINE